MTGYRYVPTAFKRTSEPTRPDAHYWLRPNDVLITRSNTPELVGHAAIYNGNPSPCIFSDLMMRLEIDPDRVHPNFLLYLLQSRESREHIEKHAKGTSPTMKKISQATVEAIPFPSDLSLSEQLRVVTQLDAHQPKVDTLRALQSETAAELDAFLPSVLAKAFADEL